MASEVARAASAYKMSSKDILGISAAMTSMGVAPEAAGTAVFKTLLGIEKATLSGGKQLSQYSKIMGLTAEETKTLFSNDKQAAFMKLVSGLSEMQKKGGSVNDSMTKLGLSNTTVIKGLTPLVSNYQDLTRTVGIANDEFLRNKALNEETETASRTMQTAINDISKSYSNLIIKNATAGSGLERIQSLLFYVSDNMETLMAVGVGLIATMGGIKATVILAKVATVGYNLVLGLSAGFSNTAAVAIGKNTVALGAYKLAQITTTAATWLATAASTAFAIAVNAATWPILAVIAAIAAVIAIFYYWDEITAWFSKQWQRFTEWLGNAWNRVISWFKEFDFKGFFMDIGQSILKFMVTPMKHFLKMATLIPGKVGNMAGSLIEKMDKLTGDGEMDINSKSVLTTPEHRQIQSNSQLKESLLSGSLDINLRDTGNKVESVENNTDGLMPVIYKTQGSWAE